MLNLNEYMGSKKTKDMIVGLVVLFVILLLVTYISSGDPEKVKALLIAYLPIIGPIGALVGIKISAQGFADFGRDKPHETEAKLKIAEARAGSEIEVAKHKADAARQHRKRAEADRDAKLGKSE